MSTTDDVDGAFEDGRKNSPSQSSFSDSNSEPTINAIDQENYYSRCFWIGKLFTSLILAESLFRKATPDMTSKELDAELLQAFVDFPYAECIEKLDGVKFVDVPEGPRGRVSNSLSTLMTKIGAVQNKGDSVARAKLVALIQSRGTTITAMDDVPKIPSPPSNGDKGGKPIAIYSITLNEWAAKKGKILTHSEKHLSLDPPRYEMRVSVEGETFTGRAKSKKQAQHIAAKEACEMLKLDVG